MQEIKKRRIVLASILKPVSDTRMTEKLACSLADKYEVHVIGFPQPDSTLNCHVRYHPLGNFKRLSINRLLAKWTIFSLVRKIKPEFLVITTHELLIPSVLLRTFYSVRIFYDVQENYFRNILYTNAFPKFVRPFLATTVCIKEWLTRPWIEKYILAEAAYTRELGFIRNRSILIENKVKRPSLPVDRRTGNAKHLIFTGTLSESTGVFIAIELASKLHHLDSTVHLTIAGFASKARDLEQIRAMMQDMPFIRLIGGDKLVPHSEIIELIRHADYGVVSYPPNPSTINSIPTKLYEYLGYRLPFLVVNHPEWTSIAARYRAAIPFEISNPDPGLILGRMHHNDFYTVDPEDVYWDSEEQKLNSLF